jgi:kynurenine formamidase
MTRQRLAVPHSLARPLRFDGHDPQHFGAPPPRRTPLQVGEFSGDVRSGASCNCATLELVPHCHGTHTESAGHLTVDALDVAEIVPLQPLPALLLSVAVTEAAATTEDSDPLPQHGDRLVTRAALAAQWPAVLPHAPRVLVVRSRDPARDAGALPAYFSRQAIALLVERGIEHLVVELPSIDRSADGGVLCAHRLFFGLDPGSTELANARRPRCTITEFAQVPAAIADGPCLVQLTLPRIAGDAVPSQPLHYRLTAPD